MRVHPLESSFCKWKSDLKPQFYGVKKEISKVGQIMLYVNNQDKAVDFWTEKAGFRVISE